jgi:hypothetical protein
MAAGAASVCALAFATGSLAQGPPKVVAGLPVVKGDYVSFTAVVNSPDNCVLGGGCPAQFILSAPPLPPSAGLSIGSLYWTNLDHSQELQYIVNMRAARQIFQFPPNTSRYTVVLSAEYAPSSVAYSQPQTFTWPAGGLTISKVDLMGAESPRLVYRADAAKTPFKSGRVTATISRLGGARLGTFRTRAELGQNVARPPRRLARRLRPGARYRVDIRLRDEFGRTARRSSHVVF